VWYGSLFTLITYLWAAGNCLGRETAIHQKPGMAETYGYPIKILPNRCPN